MANKYTNVNADISAKENLKYFNTFFDKRYLDKHISGYSYVFVTKPSLFINPMNEITENIDNLAYDNMCKDPFFIPFLNTEAINELDYLLASQLSYKNDDSYFLPIFTNSAQSFDTTDTVLETTDTLDTRQGFKTQLPTYKTASESANNLSILIKETRNLDFTKLLGLWVNYISNVTDGIFYANPNMIRNGMIDYMSSIYYFVTEPDGVTLKFWAKYTGCYPLNIPYSAYKYSMGDRSLVDIDCQFTYTIKEEMNPCILEDFNRVSLKIADLNANDTYDTNSEELDYISFKQSSLLSRDLLLNGELSANIKDTTRSPIVYYRNFSSKKTTNSDELLGKYVISFGQEDLTRDIRTDLYGDYLNDYVDKTPYSVELDD